MGRKPLHDYAALKIEYKERRAAKEPKAAIEADFKARGINLGTVENYKAGTTPKKDTTTKAKDSDTVQKVRKEQGPTIKSIALQDIIVDPEIQQRVMMTDSLIKEYIELMTEGETLPPVVVFGPTENARYYLSEGFHRYEAAKKMGFMAIPSVIRSGGYDEAIDYACEANTKHGLRPSEKDRMKAVHTQLTKWPERSSREIARKCGVSQTTVANRRIAYIKTDLVDHPERKDMEIAQQWYVKPETVATIRAEIYPPKAEEPPEEPQKPVQMDTPHESQEQDASIPSDHETTVHLDTSHELTPESKEPSDPVSAPEPPDRRPPLKTLERVLELYTSLDQESYSIKTILNNVQEAGGYEVFVNALDSSQRVALLAKMTVTLRELAAFHQSFEMIVNGPIMTPSTSDATLQAMTDATDKAMEQDPEEIE